MNTPTARNNASLPAHRTSEVNAQPSGAAGKGAKDADNTGNAKNANAEAETPSSPVEREAALARVPKGPFKIMTIPQAWYDSLHAGSIAAGGPGKERG